MLSQEIRTAIKNNLKKVSNEDLEQMGWDWFGEIYMGPKIIGETVGVDLVVIPGHVIKFKTKEEEELNKQLGAVLIQQRNIWARENYMRYRSKWREIKPLLEKQFTL